LDSLSDHHILKDSLLALTLLPFEYPFLLLHASSPTDCVTPAFISVTDSMLKPQPVGPGKIARLINKGKIDSSKLTTMKTLKSRMSPFVNSRGRKGKNEEEEVAREFVDKKDSFKGLTKSLKIWFLVVNAAILSNKRALLPIKKLRSSLLANSKSHRTLFGFIVFRVEWKDVRGMNYLNELQTDTSLAVEAKYMKKWEFDSIAHAHGNGNVVAARAEGNNNEINGNPIRCYNCQGEDHYASNCAVKPRKQDDAYLQKQMQIAQKEEAGIQLTSEEFYFMAVADKAPVYDTDGLAELSKEKSTVSSLQEEKKMLKSDFKIREDELLDKQIQLENKIKKLDNILVKTGQSIQTTHMLSPKPDSFYHCEQKMDLGYQNPFYLKQAQLKQHSLYNGKVLLEKHDLPTEYDSKKTLQLAQESRLKMKQLNK
nr:hypothetical protein CTI12_AA259060 [Tanacetum cinerariifolium]